jgi:hypothetical protein
MKKIVEFLRDYWFPVMMALLIFCMVLSFFMIPQPHNEALKDYKDGIQNHLVWSNTGKCYFVRPNDDVTVYLIQVPDCNKGN